MGHNSDDCAFSFLCTVQSLPLQEALQHEEQRVQSLWEDRGNDERAAVAADAEWHDVLAAGRSCRARCDRA